ncbi:uncharacterized protein C8A04DRAFT_38862 [Dichotomopilus funicola]|uniref:Zn(2)-C6 fungal-type domain-containing protein n=1 Tax=Dichotomopilus funicola TaxID=1934379 RepID=A0AAN6ZL72_9PEZI|nr:hypothetical protein C8A04DRAFT_38862 [Dichotomopilus funicola]
MPRRLLRNSKACDFCHKRRIKCQENPLDPSRCQNCTDFDVRCTYSRPSKRGTGSLHDAARPVQRQLTDPESPPRDRSRVIVPQIPSGFRDPAVNHDHRGFGQGDDSAQTETGCAEPLSPAWREFARFATPVVRTLLAVYHETVYPIFPFFDPIRLERRLNALEHSRNRGFFSSIMAACALSLARVRDGALASSRPQPEELGAMCPEMFFAAAEEGLPRNILHCRDFDHLRGYALLALASLQDAKLRAMQMYMGHYFTVLAVNQWHDESNWPQDIGASEREERRRLYWSMYTLDVYSSVVWDGCIHYQESHATVEYPSGRNDTNAEDPNDGANWFVGWNFTTDLYRILEHNLSMLRSRSSSFNLTGDRNMGGRSLSLTSQDRVSQLYSALPPVFKELQPATGDPARDIYGFQSANIQATMALLRMVYLSLEEGADIETKCSVVSDVLATFHQVPKPYLRAISTPLIYHIGGIGTILGSVMEGRLSESSCRRVRELLLSMADLLESLEAFLHRSAGAGQRLRGLVVRLEEYMQTKASQNQAGVAEAAGPGPALQEIPSDEWGQPGLSDLSPQFQLPDEFLVDWTWPFSMSNNYLSF